MTKGARMALFMVLATLGNVAATTILFIGLLALYAVSLARLLPPESSGWAITACFLLAMAGTALIYRALLKKFRTKWGLDNLPVSGAGKNRSLKD